MPAPYPVLGGPRFSEVALAQGVANMMQAEKRAASVLPVLARVA
jgi:hypothetical protein